MDQFGGARRAGYKLEREHPSSDPFAAAIRATRMAMIITDPREDDNPIIFANPAFARLTGYDVESVIGQNCRFLQGAETNPEAVARIREAIGLERDLTVDILNYRRDGSQFWNALYVSPVFDADGSLIYFFSSQLDITARKQVELQLRDNKAWLEAEVERRTSDMKAALDRQTTLLHEVDHRVKNNLQLVSSLILMHIRRISDEETKSSLRGMLGRVSALSTIHRKLYGDSVDRFDLAAFIRDLTDDLLGAAGRTDIRVAFDMEHAYLPAAKAAPVALIVNEVLTNALKHAFPPDRPGAIEVSLRRKDDAYVLCIADNGVGRQGDGARGPGGFGGQILDMLRKQIGAELATSDNHPGTRVAISFQAGEEP